MPYAQLQKWVRAVFAVQERTLPHSDQHHGGLKMGRLKNALISGGEALNIVRYDGIACLRVRPSRGRAQQAGTCIQTFSGFSGID